MHKQKGQALVEFALIIPFFLLLIFGLIYSGLLFHDYNTLSNTARSAAREAALLPVTASDNDYKSIKDHYLGKTTVTSLYTYNPTTDFVVQREGSGNDVYVKVRIHMVRNVTSYIMNVVLPPSFDIIYYMKKDSPATGS